VHLPGLLPFCSCPTPSCADACVQLLPANVRAGYEVTGAAIAFKIIFTISKNKKYIAFTINILSIDTL